MTTALYGLKTCDTCRKARQWLDAAGIEHDFVDVRADGVDPDHLLEWVDKAGWQNLLNRRSRAWRELPEAERTQLDETRAVALMLAEPTLIKRPVLECQAGVLVGFSTTRYEAALADK